MKERAQFPKNFLFGAATSAHQVEGNNFKNDWWEWENSQNRIRSLTKLGLAPANFISGQACDHYNRYEEDFEIARSLHHNAHRFSVEWSRIEPKEGQWNTEAIEHYRNVFRALKERNIIPFVMLHHFTNPVWFARQGGWTSSKSPERFQRYAAFVAEHLGNEDVYWMTLNEPSAYAYESFVSGRWPPQKRNPLLAILVLSNMRRAHRLAYKALKARGATRVGIAFNIHAWRPLAASAGDRFAAHIANHLTWQWFLDGIRNELDFIGVNYYFTNRIGLRIGNPVSRGCGAKIKSDMGWDVCPQGLFEVLTSVWKRYHKTIIVTENGIADAADSRRTEFIYRHLTELHRAMEAGADVRGYLYWSLLDNFEWAEGFAPRFGLVSINYETLKRDPRPSAKFYSAICQTRTLPEKIIIEPIPAEKLSQA